MFAFGLTPGIEETSRSELTATDKTLEIIRPLIIDIDQRAIPGFAREFGLPPSQRIWFARHDNFRLCRIRRFDRVVRCERSSGVCRPQTAHRAISPRSISQNRHATTPQMHKTITLSDAVEKIPDGASGGALFAMSFYDAEKVIEHYN